jgi:RNA polymerase sigma-70 factor (ECF subfamily)
MDDASVNLLARWQSGDQQAASELFHRYAERLIALAHSRLSAKLATRAAPEDVVQSVYCSFFAGARDGRYVLQQSGDLWRLLVTITLNKVQHQLKRHTSGKRSITMEQPLETGDGSLLIPPELLVNEPTPDESVALTELVEKVMAPLEPLQRRIVELRLQGHGVTEIAEMTGRTRPTVRRVLDRVKEQLAEEEELGNG